MKLILVLCAVVVCSLAEEYFMEKPSKPFYNTRDWQPRPSSKFEKFGSWPDSDEDSIDDSFDSDSDSDSSDSSESNEGFFLRNDLPLRRNGRFVRPAQEKYPAYKMD